MDTATMTPQHAVPVDTPAGPPIAAAVVLGPVEAEAEAAFALPTTPPSFAPATASAAASPPPSAATEEPPLPPPLPPRSSDDAAADEMPLPPALPPRATEAVAEEIDEMPPLPPTTDPDLSVPRDQIPKKIKELKELLVSSNTNSRQRC